MSRFVLFLIATLITLTYTSADAAYWKGLASAGAGVSPVVQSLTCTISSPVTNASNVVQTQGAGNCAYSATCSGGACIGGNAITSWSITSQSCSNCYSVTSAGVLQGGSGAASVTTEQDTVTVTATNANGTSSGVTQTVNAYADGSIGAAAGGTVQYSNFFTSRALQSGQTYSTRPPWNVAGVDYAVGVPSGALKDPLSASLPSGCPIPVTR